MQQERPPLGGSAALTTWSVVKKQTIFVIPLNLSSICTQSEAADDVFSGFEAIGAPPDLRRARFGIAGVKGQLSPNFCLLPALSSTKPVLSANPACCTSINIEVRSRYPSQLKSTSSVDRVNIAGSSLPIYSHVKSLGASLAYISDLTFAEMMKLESATLMPMLHATFDLFYPKMLPIE